jgi:hypothetical protein
VTFAIGVVAECAALSVVGPTVVSSAEFGMILQARAWCGQSAATQILNLAGVTSLPSFPFGCAMLVLSQKDA